MLECRLPLANEECHRLDVWYRIQIIKRELDVLIRQRAEIEAAKKKEE
jgi:hypothetical protein